MEEFKYCHIVQYYETDQMKVVHHSNYIRWFEEARVALLCHINEPCDQLEEIGIIIPVVDVSCKYRNMTRFGETVEIVPSITKFNGVIMNFSYEIYGTQSKDLKVTGTSSHCFLNEDYKTISIKKKFPEIYKKFLETMQQPETF